MTVCDARVVLCRGVACSVSVSTEVFAAADGPGGVVLWTARHPRHLAENLVVAGRGLSRVCLSCASVCGVGRAV